MDYKKIVILILIIVVVLVMVGLIRSIPEDSNFKSEVSFENNTTVLDNLVVNKVEDGKFEVYDNEGNYKDTVEDSTGLDIYVTDPTYNPNPTGELITEDNKENSINENKNN